MGDDIDNQLQQRLARLRAGTAAAKSSPAVASKAKPKPVAGENGTGFKPAPKKVASAVATAAGWGAKLPRAMAKKKAVPVQPPLPDRPPPPPDELHTDGLQENLGLREAVELLNSASDSEALRQALEIVEGETKPSGVKRKNPYPPATSNIPSSYGRGGGAAKHSRGESGMRVRRGRDRESVRDLDPVATEDDLDVAEDEYQAHLRSIQQKKTKTSKSVDPPPRSSPPRSPLIAPRKITDLSSPSPSPLPKRSLNTQPKPPPEPVAAPEPVISEPKVTSEALEYLKGEERKIAMLKELEELRVSRRDQHQMFLDFLREVDDREVELMDEISLMGIDPGDFQGLPPQQDIFKPNVTPHPEESHPEQSGEFRNQEHFVQGDLQPDERARFDDDVVQNNYANIPPPPPELRQSESFYSTGSMDVDRDRDFRDRDPKFDDGIRRVYLDDEPKYHDAFSGRNAQFPDEPHQMSVDEPRIRDRIAVPSPPRQPPPPPRERSPKRNFKDLVADRKNQLLAAKEKSKIQSLAAKEREAEQFSGKDAKVDREKPTWGSMLRPDAERKAAERKAEPKPAEKKSKFGTKNMAEALASVRERIAAGRKDYSRADQDTSNSNQFKFSGVSARAASRAAPSKTVASKSKSKNFYEERFHDTKCCLVVGDGNMTFSQTLVDYCTNDEHSPHLVCSTYHSKDELVELYGDLVDPTISAIESSPNAMVLHGVDAMNLTKTFTPEWFQQNAITPADDSCKNSLFDKIFWNFPHAGCVKGFGDGHEFVGWRHVNLMRKFFRSARSVLKRGGTIKVSTNLKSKGVDAADMVKFAESEGFTLMSKKIFSDWALSDYKKSFGDYRDARDRETNRSWSRDKPGGRNSDVYCQDYLDDQLFEFKFEGEHTEDTLTTSQLVPQPSLSDVVANVKCCACGLIAPLGEADKFRPTHFRSSGEHAERDAGLKLEQVEDLLMSFAAFT